MRQLMIQVPRGHGPAVMQIARGHRAANLACVPSDSGEGPADLVVAHVSNGSVEGLIDELGAIEGNRITLLPSGVIVLQPPAGQAPDQVLEVEGVSPIEILLRGLQSIGSWSGFLAYAALAGVVVWVGLYTNAAYLLVAAMLIAPFAGPAMNAAMGTARGDLYLLGRSVARYAAALLVTIAVTFGLSLVLQQQSLTPMAIDVSTVSAVAVLLPLIAGAAGAIFLKQAEHSSLVSGAAVGVLVAASIAPPAGLVGMAAALGRWDLARDGSFVLLLQLAGINLSGALTFRLVGGIRPHGSRFERGRRSVLWTALTITAVALAGLLLWQFWNPPSLQHGSRSQRAAGEVATVIGDSASVDLVEVQARFTRPADTGENLLLVIAYVRPRPGAAPAEVLRQRLSATIEERLRRRYHVTPLVDVNVVGEARGQGLVPRKE